MALIKRLTTKGFKSFANKTELIFGDKFNCILGPNGSGKSVRGDTKVLLNTGEVKEIKEIVETALANSKKVANLDDGIYTQDSTSKIKILALDNFKVVEKQISNFIRREGEPHLFEIKTRSGKKTVTTGCHPVMIYKRGTVVSEVVRNLKKGQQIATPRILKLKSKTISFKNKKINDELARLIGYLIGDGYICNNRIEIVNSDQELLSDFKFLIKKIFNTTVQYEKKVGKATRLICWSKDISSFFYSLFRRDKTQKSITSLYKNIPAELLVSDNKVIRNLLAALYDTDGTVNKSVDTIEFTNKNEELINQMQLLLLRFGIIAIKKEKYKAAINTKAKLKKKYFTILVYGKNQISIFVKNISLKCNHKRTRLEEAIKKDIKTNPNLDVLPKEINKIIRECKDILNITYKPLRSKYPRFAAYCEDRCCPTREGIKEVLTIFKERIELYINNKNRLSINSDLVSVLDKCKLSSIEAADYINITRSAITNNWKKGKFFPKPENRKKLLEYLKLALNRSINKSQEPMNILKDMSSSDIYWDEILEIKKVSGEKYVYDLTIPNCHNFIGNGIFVHNSNICDALCFVLGKGSAKGMRAEKSANLIYHGGKKGKAVNQAEVSIEFDNKDRSFPIQEDNIILTRTVKENGNSVYKINDIQRTKQQFLELLNAAHIDPDGHNIILQGDVIAFTDMKPLERRTVIEEIAGISAYEERKEKCLKELEKVDAKLNETEIILVEREKNLKELKKDRDQAKRYKELEQNIKEDKATLIDSKIREKQSELDELEKRKSQFQLVIDKIRKEIEEANNKISEWEEQVTEINKKFEDEGEKEQLVIRKQIDNLKEEIVKTDSRLEVCTSEVSKIKSRKEQLKETILDFDEHILELKNKASSVVKDLKATEKEESILESELKNFKSQHELESNSMQDFEKLESDLEKVTELISNIKEKKQDIIRSKDQLEYQQKIIDEKIANIKGEGKSKELQELKRYKEECKKVVEGLNKAINENVSFTNQLTDLRKKIYKAEEELSKLRTKQLTIQDFSLGDLAVRKILSLRKENKGIKGTVAELGGVDEKYAKALSVAAGSRIHSIVVDTDQIAKECIERLRENKLGTARFLPLNKLNVKPIERNIKELLKIKGVHGLALDLVEYDKKYEKVFSYVFGNTLVIENLDSARKVGIGRIRMVSLEGDLVESSGAMIGGYRMKNELAGFREKQIDENVIKYEEEIVKLKKLINNIDPKKISNELFIQDLRERKATLEGEILKIEKALNIDGNALEGLSKEREIFSQSIKAVEKDVKNLDKEIENHQTNFAELRVKRNNLKEKLSNPEIIQNIASLEDKKLDLKEQKIGFEGELKNIDAQINSMILPEKERTEKIIRQQEKELELFSKEIVDLAEILKERRKELQLKEKSETRFRQEFKDQIEKRNKIQEKIKAKETEAAIKQEKIRGNENKINELAIDRARFLAEMEGLNKEFEPFRECKIKRGQSVEELKARIKELEKELSKIGNVNLRALEVYEEIEREYGKVVAKVSELKSEKDSVLNLMNEIEIKKIEIFLKTFKEINKNFKQIFLSLSNKGEAFLELEEKENPFEGGLDIRVKLLSGKYMDLKSLSGGEKTMTALALIFAIQEYNPSPFYLLDEVDAALDKTNSELLSKLVSKYSNNAQYIIISHNDTIITEADQIYGISMQEGVSKVVSLKV